MQLCDGITLLCVALHCGALHYIISDCNPSCCVLLRVITMQCIAVYCLESLNFNTIHYPNPAGERRRNHGQFPNFESCYIVGTYRYWLYTLSFPSSSSTKEQSCCGSATQADELAHRCKPRRSDIHRVAKKILVGARAQACPPLRRVTNRRRRLAGARPRAGIARLWLPHKPRLSTPRRI